MIHGKIFIATHTIVLISFPLIMSEKYKFYLGFENSVCRDYITEKFWTILVKTTTVPIVFGGTDINRWKLNRYDLKMRVRS